MLYKIYYDNRFICEIYNAYDCKDLLMNYIKPYRNSNHLSVKMYSNNNGKLYGIFTYDEFVNIWR